MFFQLENNPWQDHFSHVVPSLAPNSWYIFPPVVSQCFKQMPSVDGSKLLYRACVKVHCVTDAPSWSHFRFVRLPLACYAHSLPSFNKLIWADLFYINELNIQVIVSLLLLLQTMSVKLQPASGTHLPPYNPLLPPPATSQVLLLANPQNVSLRSAADLLLNIIATDLTPYFTVTNRT